MLRSVFPVSMDEYRGRPIGFHGLRLAPYLSPWFSLGVPLLKVSRLPVIATETSLLAAIMVVVIATISPMPLREVEGCVDAGS